MILGDNQLGNTELGGRRGGSLIKRVASKIIGKLRKLRINFKIRR